MWQKYLKQKKSSLNFYSHIPCGMWLVIRRCYSDSHFISTHTSRVGCDCGRKQSKKIPKLISTHTSRVGCDKCTIYYFWYLFNFYSHIPCGMWQKQGEQVQVGLKFLLTHPVWDVTVTAFETGERVTVISTHTSRVGCDALKGYRGLILSIISTHTSRVGCDDFKPML